ncbi:hypothetical protein BJF90_34815 [Pseudonocardia sp. CNS-004]|nr:hypothetical protein BJF90_34815 [Pseudonocardia sp. CNS-004]
MLIWTAGFLGFPIGGLVGTAVAGRVDDPVAALLGGAVTGLVIGAGQAVVSSRRLDLRRWIPATTIGMGLGLLLGAATVGYGISLAELALMGAMTGLVLGVAQAIALPRHTQLRWAWAAALPLLWALGWTVTTLAMVSVDEQFTVFGAAGAVTFSALSGLLLHRLPAPAGRRLRGSGAHSEHRDAMSTGRNVILGGAAPLVWPPFDAVRRRSEPSGWSTVPATPECPPSPAAPPWLIRRSIWRTRSGRRNFLSTAAAVEAHRGRRSHSTEENHVPVRVHDACARSQF